MDAGSLSWSRRFHAIRIGATKTRCRGALGGPFLSHMETAALAVFFEILVIFALWQKSLRRLRWWTNGRHERRTRRIGVEWHQVGRVF
jgi:hypothetical protein